MLIRLATVHDIDAIMQLVKEVVPLMQASGNFQWDSTYANPEVFNKDIEIGQLWVAELDGEIGGVAAITTDQPEEYVHAGMDVSKPAIVIHRLAVGIKSRGKGIAERLLEQAELVAKERGIAILRIDTNSNNKATQRLFPKAGYKFMGEIPLHFRPNLSFFCYEKTI